MTAEPPALLVVGHGSRSSPGVAEYWALVEAVRRRAGTVRVEGGFIELAHPDLDAAVARLVSAGAGSVVAVPLVLLGAGHMKDDGPALLTRARRRHPGAVFRYGRALGIHPAVLAVAEDRVRAALGSWRGRDVAVVLVGRGSTDPDANADLYKVARLLQDSRGLAAVEPAFVSLAPPAVPEALERCRRLGATRVVVVPYFLFTGVLVDRIGAQARSWATTKDVEVNVGSHLGADDRLAALVMERYREAGAGGALMNCDCCIYRAPLPGYERRVGAPVLAGSPVPPEGR